MNNNPVEIGKQKDQQRDSVNFGVWMTTLFVGHALGMAIAAALVGLILNIAPRRLLAPYALLVYCGFVFAPLLYWARVARSQPRLYATRFAVAMFLYLQVLMLAIGWSAIKLNLAQTSILDEYIFTIPFSAIACIGLYVGVRRMREAGKP